MFLFANQVKPTLFQKLQRRQKSCKMIKWESESEREKAEEIMKLGYMSTDESDKEDVEEDGLLTHLNLLRTLPRTWESVAVTSLKRKLDFNFATNCSVASANAQLPRKVSKNKQSSAPIPKSAPAWTIKLD